MSGPEPKRSYYAINANVGAYTDIPCTIPCRRMLIQEVRSSAGAAYNPQGLRMKFKNDRSGTAYATVEYGAPGDDIDIVHPSMAGDAKAPIIGLPAQNVPATYAGGTTYGLNDVVTYSGLTYFSLAANNVGNQPDISPTKWQAYTNYFTYAADVPVKLLSDTAVATQVEVYEWS